MERMPFIVEEPRSRSDFSAMEELQIEVWSRDTSLPLPMLWVAVETGGLALVARRPAEDDVIGFCLAVAAFDGKDAWLWSHMAAVKEGWRSHGVGRALKYRQYHWARQRGFPLITWTFDPLMAKNAYFNLVYLKAMARTFFPNHYGPMDDPLNKGLPTDRFLCEWWIEEEDPWQRGEAFPQPLPPGPVFLEAVASSHPLLPRPRLHPDVEASPEGGEALEGTWSSDGNIRRLQRPAPSWRREEALLGLREGAAYIEIPWDFLALKDRDFDLAIAWRRASAAAFNYAFRRGWVAVHVERFPQEGKARYLLVPGQKGDSS
ncbi:MAG: hypothetical protein KM310_06460 [Clostridiales bacterium]|nr:hypothetical protein [Clostridiales bacterium]